MHFSLRYFRTLYFTCVCTKERIKRTYDFHLCWCDGRGTRSSAASCRFLYGRRANGLGIKVTFSKRSPAFSIEKQTVGTGFPGPPIGVGVGPVLTALQDLCLSFRVHSYPITSCSIASHSQQTCKSWPNWGVQI